MDFGLKTLDLKLAISRRNGHITSQAEATDDIRVGRTHKDIPVAFGRAENAEIGLAVAVEIRWNGNVALDAPFYDFETAVRA